MSAISGFSDQAQLDELRNLLNVGKLQSVFEMILRRLDKHGHSLAKLEEAIVNKVSQTEMDKMEEKMKQVEQLKLKCASNEIDIGQRVSWTKFEDTMKDLHIILKNKVDRSELDAQNDVIEHTALEVSKMQRSLQEKAAKEDVERDKWEMKKEVAQLRDTITSVDAAKADMVLLDTLSNRCRALGQDVQAVVEALGNKMERPEVQCISVQLESLQRKVEEHMVQENNERTMLQRSVVQRCQGLVNEATSAVFAKTAALEEDVRDVCGLVFQGIVPARKNAYTGPTNTTTDGGTSASGRGTPYTTHTGGGGGGGGGKATKSYGSWMALLETNTGAIKSLQEVLQRVIEQEREDVMRLQDCKAERRELETILLDFVQTQDIDRLQQRLVSAVQREQDVVESLRQELDMVKTDIITLRPALTKHIPKLEEEVHTLKEQLEDFARTASTLPTPQVHKMLVDLAAQMTDKLDAAALDAAVRQVQGNLGSSIDSLREFVVDSINKTDAGNMQRRLEKHSKILLDKMDRSEYARHRRSIDPLMQWWMARHSDDPGSAAAVHAKCLVCDHPAVYNASYPFPTPVADYKQQRQSQLRISGPLSAREREKDRERLSSRPPMHPSSSENDWFPQSGQSTPGQQHSHTPTPPPPNVLKARPSSARPFVGGK